MDKPNYYLDHEYRDLSDRVEADYQPTLVDIQSDPHYYAELVNDLMYHWIHGTRETPLMNHAKKAHLERYYASSQV